MLHLVRHSQPKVEPRMRPSDWTRNPAKQHDLRALGDSGSLPAVANWYTSPEKKAVETARLLSGGQATKIVQGLSEQDRGEIWVEDFHSTVLRAFNSPHEAVAPGWEPANVTQRRVATTAHRILQAERSDDIVLVGHGFAFTLLVAEITHSPPDIDAWAAMLMPDHCAIDNGRVVAVWGGWSDH